MNDYRYYYSSSNELYHHGIKGMSWGRRNGPPYPLQSFQKKVGDAVAKGKRVLANVTSDAGKALVRVYKTEAEKAKAKAAEARAQKQAEREELAKRQKEASARAKLIKMAKEHPELLTNQELMDLNNRARQENSLKENYSSKTKKGEGTVSQSKNALVSEVIKPGVVALGKAAAMAAIGGGDFQKIASVQLDKAYNKGSKSGDSGGEKKEKKKKFAGFEFKIKRE